MSFFSLLPSDLCLLVLTFIDFDSLITMAQVEKYLGNLLSDIATWQYLHKHRLPHLDDIPTTIHDIRKEIWLSQHYYLTIVNVDNEKFTLTSSNLDIIKGCLCAYHQFANQKPFVYNYKIAFTLLQPGLIEVTPDQIKTLLKPHRLNVNSRDLIDRDKIAIMHLLVNQHRVDRVTCQPYCWSSNQWYIKPFYLVDATDEMKVGFIQTLQHLGLEGVTIKQHLLNP